MIDPYSSEVIPPAAESSMTLNDLAAELERVYANITAPTSIRQIRQALHSFAEATGARSVESINSHEIRRWANVMMGSRLARETIKGRIGFLRVACVYAHAKKYLTQNPFELVSNYIPAGYQISRERAITPLDVDRVDRLMVHLLAESGDWEGHRLLALVASVVYLGLRRNEALELRHENIDLLHKRIWIGTRALTVPGKLVEIFDRWIPETRSVWCFPGVKLQGAWTGGAHGKRAIDSIRTAGEAVGIDQLSFEALRAFTLSRRSPICLPTFESTPAPGHESEGPKVCPPGPLPGSVPVLQLQGPRRRPLIRGTPLERILTDAEFRILSAMKEYGCLEGKRISGKELDSESQTDCASRHFRRWRETTPLLASIIDLPGGKGGADDSVGERKSGYSFTPL